jgi:imidazoleglycerol-phosphate dehydratase
MRHATLTRQTKETRIDLTLDLDAPVDGPVVTGSGFLDHMLDLFRKHGGFGLSVTCRGDGHIDMHHSAEDIAICLGEALRQALGDKSGIERYGV